MSNRTETLNFKATPEQRERVDQLAQALGKNRSDVLRELIDGAMLVRPVLVSTFNQSASYQNEMVQHVG